MLRKLIFILLNLLVFGLNVDAREVPYFRQSDFVGFGSSACGPTSLAMIIKYYYPYSQVNPGKIYHSGTQAYKYKGGPINLYKNSGYANFIKNKYSNIVTHSDNMYKTSYNKGNYSGMYQPSTSYIKDFLKKWGFEVEFYSVKGLVQQRLNSLLKESPLLVYENGHYLLLKDYNITGNYYTVHNPWVLRTKVNKYYQPISGKWIYYYKDYYNFYVYRNGKKIKVSKLTYNNFTGKKIKVKISTNNDKLVEYKDNALIHSGVSKKVPFEYIKNKYINLSKITLIDRTINSFRPNYSVLVDSTDINLDKYTYNTDFNITGYKYKVYNHPINNWTYKFNENNKIAWYKIYDPWIDNIKGSQKFNEMEVNYGGNIDDIRYYYGGGKSFIYLSKNSSVKSINSIKWKPALYKKSYFDIIYSYYDKGATDTLKFYLKDKDNQVIAKKEIQYRNDGKSKQITLWKNILLYNGDYVEVDNIGRDINIDAVFFKNIPDIMPLCYNKMKLSKNTSNKCAEWFKEKITPYTLATTLVSYYNFYNKKQNLQGVLKNILDILNKGNGVYITREEFAKIFITLFKDKLQYSDKLSLYALSKIQYKFNAILRNIPKQEFIKKYKNYEWLYNWAVENKWTNEGIVLKLNKIWNGYKGDMMSKAFVNNFVLLKMLINLEKYHMSIKKK